MKAYNYSVKWAVFCILLFANWCLFPDNARAQSCPYTWPEISIEWRLGPDNYYTYGNLSGAGNDVLMSADTLRFL